MLELVTFFIILAAAVTFSAVFSRLHLPWVLALIVAGVIMGPNGFALIEIDATMQFMGDIGLIFLMFLAGLETPVKTVGTKGASIFFLAFINGFIPFIFGTLIAWGFGYDLVSILILGIIFISSSVALVIPTLESYKLINKPIGSAVLATTLIQDIASLLFLSILLQNVKPITTIPLPIFYLLIGIAIFSGRYLFKIVNSMYSRFFSKKKDLFEQELRAIFLILFGTVILFELMGLHSLIAGFFAGLVLADSVKQHQIKHKLHAIGYGIFIPIFFIIIGINTNFALLFEAKSVLVFVAIVALGSMLSKYLSGMIAARLRGYNKEQATVFGLSSIPQLSTTLAVVYSSYQLELVDDKMVTAMIILSIATTLVSPLVMNTYIARNRKMIAKSI